MSTFQMESIAMIGAGYVGLVSGTCFSALGFDVSVMDVSEKKIKALKEGEIPIYEPGLSSLVNESVEEGRLHFFTSVEDIFKNKKPEVIFICVGTPENPDGSCNMDYVYSAVKSVVSAAKNDVVLVLKSTVPPGTAKKVKTLIEDLKPKFKVGVVNNPEFLKEGSAVNDFMRPDRVVLGGTDPWALDKVRALYDSLLHNGHPLFVTDHESAELAKLSANLMLASRVSVINQVSRLSSALGGDIKQVEAILRSDSRIGSKYLYSGLGYGGSCFPKDVKSFIHECEALGVDASLAKSIDDFNDSQKLFFINEITKRFPNPQQTTIALLGVAFKPETDDIREAPSLTLSKELCAKGYKIKAYDPKALENFKAWADQNHLKHITYAKSLADCLEGADALVLTAEWQEFQRLSPEKLKSVFKGKVIFDGKNVFKGPLFSRAGFEYFGVGRTYHST